MKTVVVFHSDVAFEEDSLWRMLAYGLEPELKLGVKCILIFVLRVKTGKMSLTRKMFGIIEYNFTHSWYKH